MVADEDVLARGLRDLNLATMSKFTLKPEQESVVTALLAGRAVLAVLPGGYGKVYFIKCLFVPRTIN